MKRLWAVYALLAAAVASGAVLQLENVPHIRQKPDFCGEACVAMYLQHLGHAGADQDYVYDQSGLDPALGRGCFTPELNAALRRIGFDTGRVWTWLEPDDTPRQVAALWQNVVDDLNLGIPSIVCMRYSADPGAPEHFRLVLGYDEASQEVIYHEPAVDDGAYRRMPLGDFASTWPLKARDGRLILVRLRLRPERLPDKILPADRLTDADYAQHVRDLRRTMPEGFSLVVQKPFVVVGNESPDTVRLRAQRTVGWAVGQLKQQYFARDPKELIDVWLFKNKETYEHYAEALFDDVPTTPYGYYSEEHHALIMNIATGGGTLVHELVHPFMDANFPACPAWFNEGLASLYEQSAEREGVIVGLTNWRLAGLQKSILARQVPTFEKLTGTTPGQFYGTGSGTHYAQARYLCYYLQEKGLLRDYYRRFTAAATTDPTGYQTLQAVLGETDMAAFQERWEQYILKLRFP